MYELQEPLFMLQKIKATGTTLRVKSYDLRGLCQQQKKVGFGR